MADLGVPWSDHRLDCQKGDLGQRGRGLGYHCRRQSRSVSQSAQPSLQVSQTSHREGAPALEMSTLLVGVRAGVLQGSPRENISLSK